MKRIEILGIEERGGGMSLHFGAGHETNRSLPVYRFLESLAKAAGAARMSSALEQSNVDLAAELTRIITYQRDYQDTARMVTVTDQIMQETMNMRQ